MDVIGEIEKREKRLNAIIEISEERIKHIEELGVRARGPQVRNYSAYYMLFMVAWLLLGAVVLSIVSKRVGGIIHIPVGLYFVLALLFSIPALYYLLAKGGTSSENPEADFVERERMARALLERFYKPFKEAVQTNDTSKIEALADKLLEDPVLASAMEALNEGDPKVVSYALLLYARYQPDLENEVREVLQRLTNKPVRVLLETLLGKGYNHLEGDSVGGNYEARSTEP
ncbi:hypothetical protein [Thermococcus stetteri]|uniref:hypothetical protein n=1 Tax=Thermococcus stetteri TaxID=49900 RepID=UPI001AE31BBD|nr:hypothetical protein [Thermococcus stetteri]MBP1911143.1 hypothetical protein [Thermococcus stetteri]